MVQTVRSALSHHTMTPDWAASESCYFLFPLRKDGLRQSLIRLKSAAMSPSTADRSVWLTDRPRCERSLPLFSDFDERGSQGIADVRSRMAGLNGWMRCLLDGGTTTVSCPFSWHKIEKNGAALREAGLWLCVRRGRNRAASQQSCLPASELSVGGRGGRQHYAGLWCCRAIQLATCLVLRPRPGPGECVLFLCSSAVTALERAEAKRTSSPPTRVKNEADEARLPWTQQFRSSSQAIAMPGSNTLSALKTPRKHDFRLDRRCTAP